MQVICLNEEAFYTLLDTVLTRMEAKSSKENQKWISADEAMKKLHIKSKTTLQKMRNEGLIRFSHPERRIILYGTESIDDYLNGYANKPSLRQ